jgi:serine/threonine-protein kinase RsbT
VVGLRIAAQIDVERARRAARLMATQLAFTREDIELVSLAVSELATNLVRYAVDGQIDLLGVEGTRGPGIQIESHDRGPGIQDVAAALRDGFSTGGGLGGGLPGVQRMMDEFELTSDLSGTTVICRKWLRHL